MAVLLALTAALGYGVADFVAGVGSKRATPYAVAMVVQISGVLGIAVYSIFDTGAPRLVDGAWALLAGVANGLGTTFLYRGLAHGRMGVVAPVSAIGSAALPVLVGLFAGEQPGILVWVGVLVGLPGIWLVSREADGGPPRGSGLVDGALAGIGFGTMFAALSQIPESAGLLPVALNELVAAAAIVVIARAFSSSSRPTRPAIVPGVAAGILAAVATSAYLMSTQQGYLTVAAILSSLYPAVTVVLAAVLLREPVHRSQAAGLCLCLAALMLVTTG